MEIPFIPPHYTTTTYTIMGKNSQQSQLSSNPLFSSIVTLYTLILLYFPQLFFNLIISPLFIPTLILLLVLLRLDASQQFKQQQPITNPSNEGAHTPLHYQIHNDDNNNNNNNINNNNNKIGPELVPDLGPEPNLVENDQSQRGGEMKVANEEWDNEQKGQCLGWAQFEPVFSPNLFLEWDVGAPLEVIYEAFEGTEEGGESQDDAFCINGSCKKTGIITDRYPSLSRYYPESDSDSDSDTDMDSKFSYTTSLDEEEGKEGLIEIALDCDYDDYYYDKGIINIIMKPNNNKVIDYEEPNFEEEDNLIEIDISPTKNMS